MKKILSILLLILGSVSLFGQVHFYEGSFQEALKKAAVENKKVLVICSATWCGPCKYLTDKILSQKEASDFLDTRVIVMKYYLDKNDPEKFVENYQVKAYPTLLLFDSEGKELNRQLGGGASVSIFLKNMDKLLDVQNYFSTWEKKIEQSPVQTLEYVKRLVKEYRMGEKAISLLTSLLDSGLKAEYFTDDLLQIYRLLMPRFSSDVTQYFIINEKKIAACMGEKRFRALMQDKGISYINQVVNKEGLTIEQYEEEVGKINQDPYMHSKFSQFMLKHGELFVSKDYKHRFEEISKMIRRMDSDTRHEVVRQTEHSIPDKLRERYKVEIIDLYTTAMWLEKKGKVYEMLRGRRNCIINLE